MMSYYEGAVLAIIVVGLLILPFGEGFVAPEPVRCIEDIAPCLESIDWEIALR